MGQAGSALVLDQNGDPVQQTTSVQGHLRRSLRRRMRKSDVSATFNILNTGSKPAQLDINRATAEQLAQLPGVSAQLAASITAHRAAIGGFTHLEDLALVTGVGAARLHRIRAALCVGRPAPHSGQPTTTNLPIDGVDGRSAAPSPHKININTANIFDLMQLQFINQELADRIVSLRDKKGGFRSLRQLSKVRGISRRTVEALRHYFTLDDASEHESNISEKTSVTAPPDVGSNPGAGAAVAIAHGRLGHRRTHSVPTNAGLNPYLEASGDICELLALHSPRPVLEEVFMSQRGGRPVFRLGTWNLESLSAEKIANPGVLEVVCRTVLETGLALLAVQEIACPDALAKICAELNTPSLHKVRNWQGWRGAWRWTVADPDGSAVRAGFLYDVSKGVQLRQQGSVGTAEATEAEAGALYVGKFKVDQFQFSVVSVRLHWPRGPTSVGDSSKLELVRSPLDGFEHSLEHILKNEDDILVVGDFGRPPDDSAFEVLRRHRFHPVVPEGVSTGSSGQAGSYSNIWMTEHTEVAYTGHFSVVRTGLSHLAIPHGWRWGGLVSGHCPVWCEMFSTAATAAGAAAPGALPAAVEQLQQEYRRRELLHRQEMAALALKTGAALQVS